MYFVTNSFQTKTFEKEQQAYNYITKDLNIFGLSYEKVYDNKNKKMRVKVYQFSSLHIETYIITEKKDIRN